MGARWFKVAMILIAMALAAGFLVWRCRIEHRYDGMIRQAAERYGVAPGVLKALIWRESRFNALARGKAGELGLMQIGDEAAHEWADFERVPGFDHNQCIDPRTNTLAGTFYLSKALSKYRQTDDPLPYALAEYNAGRGNVLRWKTGRAQTNSESFIQQITFRSTSNYVRDIIGRKGRYQKEFDKAP